METDEVCSESLNVHQRVFELLAQALKPNEKYLIVFVLVKCETYIKSETKREALLDRFQVRHKAVLNLIDRLNEHGKNVAGVLIPVNTLGCVQFKQLVKTDNSSVPSFEFMRTSREFATKDVDQPLRYALAFAFAHVQAGSSIWTSLIRPGESMVAAVRRRLSGRRAVFATAVQHFCQERQKGYRTYGNTGLLG